MVDFVLNKRPRVIHSTHCPFQGAPLAGWTLIPMMDHHTRCVKASSFETAVRVSGTFFWVPSMKKNVFKEELGLLSLTVVFRITFEHTEGWVGRWTRLIKINLQGTVIKQQGRFPSVTSKLHSMWRQFSQTKESQQQPWDIGMARPRHYVLECVHVYIHPRLITYRQYVFKENI